ncbi:MAG: SurA N-terminal domain-containing protein [Chloroflexi bacterium]|nr:SurA N-terminal domain-containing protein [Chloroflexota bacterium]
MSKRRTKIPTPTWEHEQTGITRKLDANRWQIWATAGILVLVFAALGVIGWAYLADYIDDQQRPGSLGLRVADSELTVAEYTTRASLFAEEFGIATATTIIPALNAALVEEALLLQFADELSATASDDEVRAEIASRLGIEADDVNFDARFEEELTRTGFSEEDFRDMARAAVLVVGVRDSFASEVAKSLPSVNYRQIQVADQDAADDLVAQLDAGADFVTLATEDSLVLDAVAGEPVWVPEGVLDPTEEAVLFGLAVNEITTFSSTNAVFVFQVLEKSESREVAEDHRITLGGAAYAAWLIEKQESVVIVNEFDLQLGNPDKVAYVISHANLDLQR